MDLWMNSSVDISSFYISKVSVWKAQLGSAPALELAGASFLAPALKPELI